MFSTSETPPRVLATYCTASNPQHLPATPHNSMCYQKWQVSNITPNSFHSRSTMPTSTAMQDSSYKLHEIEISEYINPVDNMIRKTTLIYHVPKDQLASSLEEHFAKSLVNCKKEE